MKTNRFTAILMLVLLTAGVAGSGGESCVTKLWNPNLNCAHHARGSTHFDESNMCLHPKRSLHGGDHGCRCVSGGSLKGVLHRVADTTCYHNDTVAHERLTESHGFSPYGSVVNMARVFTIASSGSDVPIQNCTLLS